MEMMYSAVSSSSVVWVPCVPDFSNGQFVPIYNLATMPCDISEKVPKLPRGGIKSIAWSHEEDNLLRELVSEYGLKKWSKIAKEINKTFNHKRKGKNCRERWNNHLNPNLNKGEWTYAEDLTLLQTYKTFGKRWSKISKELSGRNENSVKNRWNTLIKNYKKTVGNHNESLTVDLLIQHFQSCIGN